MKWPDVRRNLIKTDCAVWAKHLFLLAMLPRNCNIMNPRQTLNTDQYCLYWWNHPDNGLQAALRVVCAFTSFAANATTRLTAVVPLMDEGIFEVHTLVATWPRKEKHDESVGCRLRKRTRHDV